MASKHQPFTQRQQMQKNTFEIFHYKDEYVKEVALHHHDFYEVYFFLSGNVQYNIESRSYLLTPGDVLLISPMELHQPMFGSEQREYERIVLWLNSGFLQQLGTDEQSMTQCFDARNPEHANLIRPDGVTRELVNYLVQQLLREQDSEDFAAELYCLSLLTQLLITSWAALVTAAETAAEAGKSTWFEVVVPKLNESFYFKGVPSPLGLDEIATDSAIEMTGHVTPNEIVGWAAKST